MTEMSKDEEARVPQRGASGATKGVPGIGTAIVIAGLAALGIGYWAKADVKLPGLPAPGGVSRVAEVAPQDVPAAIETIDAPAEQLAQLKGRKPCSVRLASVTIRRGPGQPDGRIRLQSGHYISPLFELTDMPVRVALPYPAPYETGRGVISVLGATTDAIVALTPPLHVPAQGGVRVQEVTWSPAGACPAGGR
jgi:hypothetical protein